MKRIRLNDKRILMIGAIVLLIIMMMDFNTRMSELQRLSNERSQLVGRVTELASTEQSIRTQIAYATSDAAVEAWARQEAHMVKPGDVLVVPEAPKDATPVPQVAVAPTPRAVSNWEVWYALFFGQ